MKIVIVGAGEVGSHLAKMLSQEWNDITVIDSDAERLARLNTIVDVVTIEGSPSSIKVMKEAEVQRADLFISVVPFAPQDVNIVSALLAKNLGAKRVTARIDDEEFLTSENRLFFKQMGIELMFYPEKLVADEIVDLLKRTAATESMDFGHGKLQIEVFKLEEDSPLLDMKLSEFAAVASSSELQFRVIAITRYGETLIPKPETKFLYHDLVFIIAKREGIKSLLKFLGKSDIEVN
jgi:trk system potassium uptake protein TrkA